MEKLSSLILEEVWVYQIFAVIFLTLILDYSQKKLFRKLFLQFKKTANYWDDVLIEAAQTPIRAAIWALGFLIAISFFPGRKSFLDSEFFQAILDIGVVAILAWFLVRFVKIGEIHFLSDQESNNKPVDKTTVHAVSKLLRLSVAITAFLVIIQTLGYSVSGLLAFGGVGGLAVGFAAKDLLANFFGGLMIHLDRPFTIGDWISSTDREIEGVVESIGWRLTIIRAFDKRPIYIPNSLFTQIVVKNPSRMTNRRIYEAIGVRYEDASKVSSITQQIRELLKGDPEIDSQQTIIVNLNQFSPSSLDIMIYAYTKEIDWVRFHNIKHKLMLRILEIIEDNGAEAAFPTSTIHLQDNPEKGVSAN